MTRINLDVMFTHVMLTLHASTLPLISSSQSQLVEREIASRLNFSFLRTVVKDSYVISGIDVWYDVRGLRSSVHCLSRSGEGISYPF